jgi:hypothetical protein
MLLRSATKKRITGVFPISGDRETCSIIVVAFGVLATTNSNRAFIRTSAIYFGALVLGIADKMSFGTATENGVAGILTRDGKSDASAVVGCAFAMFSATNSRRAFIRTTSIDLDALILIITDKMLYGTTTNNRIALVFSISGKGKAGAIILGAFRMFAATNFYRTCVCTFTVYLDTLVLIVTNEMFDRTAAKKRITGIGPISRNSDAGSIVIVAFGMLCTADSRGTFVRTSPAHLDTLILTVTHKMILRATTDDGIAFIVACTGNGNAGGVIGGALRMFTTGDKS